MEDVLIALGIGLVGGLAAGLLGIGGGAVFVPGLVILVGTEQIVAQGISLTVIIVTAAVAAARHRHNRTIDYHVARWTAVPAVALAVVGALIANEIGRRHIAPRVRNRAADSLSAHDLPNCPHLACGGPGASGGAGRPPRLPMNAEALAELNGRIASCTACALHQGRTQTVPGDGDANAELLFIGEAPGFNEDKQGSPFVGQAGRVLDQLLQEIELTRRDVFVANVIKCRPAQQSRPAAGGDRDL